MVRLRRILGPLVAAWLLCQAGSVAAIPVPDSADVTVISIDTPAQTADPSPDGLRPVPPDPPPPRA